MHQTSTLQQPRQDLTTWAARLLTAGLLAFGALTAGVVPLAGGIRLFYSGSALPGVYVGSVDVSGLSQPEIEAALAGQISYPITGRLALRDGSQVWTAAPGEVGARLGTPAMASAAPPGGRAGARPGGPRAQPPARLAAGSRGVGPPPILIFDERVAAEVLDGLAAEIDLPTVEAGALINGREVQVTAGQVGRQLDVSAALDSLPAPPARV